MDDRLGELDPLLHSGREVAQIAESLLFETDQEQRLRGAPPRLAPWDPGQLGRIGDEVRSRLILGETVPLRHVSDAGADDQWLALRVVAQHRHPARCGVEEAEHQPEQCGLPRPVRPDQPGDTGRHLQIQVLDGHDRAVVVGEALDFEDRQDTLPPTGESRTGIRRRVSSRWDELGPGTRSLEPWWAGKAIGEHPERPPTGPLIPPPRGSRGPRGAPAAPWCTAAGPCRAATGENVWRGGICRLPTGRS